jgi:cysteine synthase
MVIAAPRQSGVEALDLIGNTPLVRLTKVTADLPAGVTIAGKAEWRNPGGSVKDRPALAMIRDGSARGLLTPRTTMLEATSGTTGIALAMIGAMLGYRVELCLPANASPERKRILRAYGAEVVLTDPLQSSDGAISEAAAALVTRLPVLLHRHDFTHGRRAVRTRTEEESANLIRIPPFTVPGDCRLLLRRPVQRHAHLRCSAE